MNNTTQGTTSRVRALQLWTAVRDELSERRQVRAQHRELQRDLASYTTRNQVDDLLAATEGQEGAEVEQIRSILANNLMQHRTYPLAS